MRSSRSPLPRPCAAETGDRLAEPEPVELGGERHVGDAVDLVRGDDHRQRRAPQQVRQLLVARAHAGARVDDEHGDVALRRARARLLADRAGERVAVLEVDAAGVDQLEARARSTRSRAPCGRASRPGRSCTTASRPPVRRLIERGLADVRVADDRDLEHAASMAAVASPRPPEPRQPADASRPALLSLALLRAARARRSGRARAGARDPRHGQRPARAPGPFGWPGAERFAVLSYEHRDLGRSRADRR